MKKQAAIRKRRVVNNFKAYDVTRYIKRLADDYEHLAKRLIRVEEALGIKGKSTNHKSCLDTLRAKRGGQMLSQAQRELRDKELDYEILFQISAQGGGLTATDLHMFLNRAKSRICKRVNDLWAREYLKRDKRPSDGYRAYNITEKGQAYLDNRKT